MNYTYQQSTGKFWYGEALLGIGYSGSRPAGPDSIPVGNYAIGPAAKDLTFSLSPSDFTIKGEAIAQPGTSGKNAIVLDLQIRRHIAIHGIFVLTVTK